MDNQDDLSQFLISRRAKLTPQQVGLPISADAAGSRACGGKKSPSWPA